MGLPFDCGALFRDVELIGFLGLGVNNIDFSFDGSDAFSKEI
ncbi:protein of unknown function [Vibrio tapetis subsp. tapetis]|uniref:Uncharacterized protein n=1 Tax=Vibrio tapetis subsp. tapetis TaxID=1671868 RepID=A0A2N8Z991_9VIBR|nr:protein of unknown function [Vibrio tapetis subsp. tapetis]